MYDFIFGIPLIWGVTFWGLVLVILVTELLAFFFNGTLTKISVDVQIFKIIKSLFQNLRGQQILSRQFFSDSSFKIEAHGKLH